MRLGPSWDINRVIDWGGGTGSGLWYISLLYRFYSLNWLRASVYSFQEGIDSEHEPHAVTSSINSYLAVDKREGLVDIGKRLVNRMFFSVSPNQY